MSHPIAQERIAEIEAIIADEAEVNGDVRWFVARELLDALTASHAEAHAAQIQIAGLQAQNLELRDELARRDAVRVEVPPVSALLLENLDRRCASYADMAERVNNWIGANARLVPAPPQADAVVVLTDDMIRREWCNLHSGVQGDPDESAYSAFEEGVRQGFALRTSAQDHNGEGASAKSGRKASEEELAAFEEWLCRVRPSGDVEQVQRAWEESSEYADLQAPGQRGEG